MSISKGESVSFSHFSLHRLTSLYGADAAEFRPERWDEDPKLRKIGWGYLPFSGGPRICLGQQFALTTAGFILVRILQCFESLERGDGVVGLIDAGFDVSMTMKPAGEVNVRYCQRGNKG